MPTLATSDQLQEVQVQVQERNLHVPERHFDTSECIETLPQICTLPRKQRRSNDGGPKCSVHPFARKIRSFVLPEYRYAQSNLLEAEERDKELFKFALARIDPMVTLPEISVQVGRHERLLQTCRWSQTRAYLGVEGLKQHVDRWEFADVHCGKDWSDIQQRLITQYALTQLSPETSFGTAITTLGLEYNVLLEMNDQQSISDRWSRDFDECISGVLLELGGRLPECTLYEQGTTPTTDGSRSSLSVSPPTGGFARFAGSDLATAATQANDLEEIGPMDVMEQLQAQPVQMPETLRELVKRSTPLLENNIGCCHGAIGDGRPGYTSFPPLSVLSG